MSTSVSIDNLLNAMGQFSWSWGDKFFIETQYGNYVWSDPDYNGDNTIRRYHGNLKHFVLDEQVQFVRDKGTHMIRRYVGDDVIPVGNL
jgi:hypothetical protein